MRKIINTPAIEAGIQKPVELDIPEIETGLREGKNGAVVVLVNYPGKTIENLKIRVHNIPVERINSIVSTSTGKQIQFNSLNEKTIEIKLPVLKDVDMIAIYYRR